jgi:hypothetical protein
VIRPFGLRDVSALRQIEPRGVAFDLRRLVLSSISPARSALVGYLSGHRLGAITCVHTDEEGCVQGAAQVWPHRDRRAWDLAFLSPSLDENKNAAHVWHELLTYLSRLGIEHNVLRIYARSPEDVEIEDLLRHCGFSMVTRQETFVLSRQPAPAPLPRGLRRVEEEDRWPLDHFHQLVMPPLVQKAEAPCHHMACMAADPFQSLSVDEYIWSRKSEIIAWLRISSSSKAHWLDIVVRPEYRAEVLPHIKYVLTLVKISKQRPLFCPIPDYCVGLGWLLRTLGFRTFTRQALMVCHTVVRVRVRHQIPLPAFERSVDVGPWAT